MKRKPNSSSAKSRVKVPWHMKPLARAESRRKGLADKSQSMKRSTKRLIESLRRFHSVPGMSRTSYARYHKLGRRNHGSQKWRDRIAKLFPSP